MTCEHLFHLPHLPLASDLTFLAISKELGVDTWEYNVYAEPANTGYPPTVLPLAHIQCQVGRGKIGFTNPPLWITTTMDRV